MSGSAASRSSDDIESVTRNAVIVGHLRFRPPILGHRASRHQALFAFSPAAERAAVGEEPVTVTAPVPPAGEEDTLITATSHWRRAGPYPFRVSDYYDLFLSVELQPGLPDGAVHEIRWHLGLVDEPPVRFQALPDADWFIGEPVPLFSGLAQSHCFDGVDVAAMLPATNRLYPDGGERWLLTEMMFMSTSRRGLTQLLTDFGSLTGFVGPGREVLVHSLDVAL